MAPTVCLPELSMQNTPPCCTSYIRRHQRTMNNNAGVIKEQQRLELKRIFNTPSEDRVVSLSPPASPVWEPISSENSFSSDYQMKNSVSNTAVSNSRTSPYMCSQHWRSILSRREGLLDIVARTMTLVKRSHVLQMRVNALRCETREFIRSVLNNPENNGNEKTLAINKDSCSCIETSVVSSSSEVLLSRPITPPPSPDSSTGYSVTSDNEQSDVDTSYSNNSVDWESDDRLDYNNDYFQHSSDYAIKVTQDPMVSSS